MEDEVEIRRATLPQDVEAALGLLLTAAGNLDVASGQTARDFAITQRIPLDHLWVADFAGLSNRFPLAAALLVCPGDRSGTVWPIAIAQDALFESRGSWSLAEETELVGQFFEVIHEVARTERVQFLQALCADYDRQTAARWLAAGMQEIGRLLVMWRSPERVDDLHDVRKPSQAISCHPIGDDYQAAEFAALLAATYEQSRDFPELLDHKSGADAVETHRSQGHFDPAYWYRIDVGGQAAGVLLLTWQAIPEHWELVYLGLIPKFRGQGIAEYVLRHILSNENFRGQPIVLGVDSRNRSAVTIYERCGFQPIHTQRAFMQPVPIRPS